jgi:hypothetical protein
VMSTVDLFTVFVAIKTDCLEWMVCLDERTVVEYQASDLWKIG